MAGKLRFGRAKQTVPVTSMAKEGLKGNTLKIKGNNKRKKDEKKRKHVKNSSSSQSGSKRGGMKKGLLETMSRRPPSSMPSLDNTPTPKKSSRKFDMIINSSLKRKEKSRPSTAGAPPTRFRRRGSAMPSLRGKMPAQPLPLNVSSDSEVSDDDFSGSNTDSDSDATDTASSGSISSFSSDSEDSSGSELVAHK